MIGPGSLVLRTTGPAAGVGAVPPRPGSRGVIASDHPPVSLAGSPHATGRGTGLRVRVDHRLPRPRRSTRGGAATSSVSASHVMSAPTVHHNPDDTDHRVWT